MALATAMTAGAETWSLDSCISYSIAHNLTVKSREISAEQGELGITEAKDRFLPQVQAGANQSWGFGRSLTAENTYASRNTSNFGWNVGLSLPLFQGLRNVRNLDYARSSMRQTLEQRRNSLQRARYLKWIFFRPSRSSRRTRCRPSQPSTTAISLCSISHSCLNCPQPTDSP